MASYRSGLAYQGVIEDQPGAEVRLWVAASPVAEFPAASELSSRPSYMLYGVIYPLDQYEVSWRLPEATSLFHASTDRPLNVASMPSGSSYRK